MNRLDGITITKDEIEDKLKIIKEQKEMLFKEKEKLDKLLTKLSAEERILLDLKHYFEGRYNDITR